MKLLSEIQGIKYSKRIVYCSTSHPISKGEYPKTIIPFLDFCVSTITMDNGNIYRFVDYHTLFSAN